MIFIKIIVGIVLLVAGFGLGCVGIVLVDVWRCRRERGFYFDDEIKQRGRDDPVS